MHQKTDTCIIVGAGSGLSASLARLFRTNDMDVVLAARNVEKLRGFSEEIGCDLVKCDSSDADQVKQLFIQTDKIFGAPSRLSLIHI